MTRIETAVRISEETFGTAANNEGTTEALISRDDLFPDALAGNYLAGVVDGPILLSGNDTVPQATLDELEDLGVTTVTLLGGTNALDTSVETQLEAAGYIVERVAGTDRYKTAAAIATGEGTVGTTAAGNTAILATGEKFPDALAAGPISFAEQFPIILTPSDMLGADADAALAALNIDHVLIAGGTSAVSGTVEAALTADGITSERLAGATRYETAVAIAEYAVSELGFRVDHAEVATGLNFPDALTGGPHGGTALAPILLANDGNTGPACAYLTSIADTVTGGAIFGGTAAVSIAVEETLEACGQDVGQVTLTSQSVEQGGALTGTITGNNIQSVTVSGCGLTNEPVGDTNATTPGIQFSETIPQAQAAGNCTLTFTITRTDGTIVTETEQVTVTAPAGQATATARPELKSAAIVGTVQTNQVTATNPAGTTVRYTFDEAVGTISAVGNFQVYRFNDSSTPIDATSAKIDPNDPKSVLALFAGLTNDPNQPTMSTADLSVATTDINAVVDGQGLANPEGDAPIGTGQQSATALTAGRTTAPDLVSLAFRTGPTATTTAVDFVFDQAAYVQNPGGFNVVLTDGSEINCTAPAENATTAGGGTTQGGNGTTTITTICANPGGGTTLLSATNVARGTVDALAVGTTPETAATTFPGVGDAACGAPNAQGTTNRCNPLEASDTPDNGSIAPDLVSVRFVYPTTGAANGTVIYTFDQPVATASLAGGNFCVYNNSGVETCNAAVAPQINTAGGSTEVAVTFAAATFSNLTGGNVRDGAVTGQGAQLNQQDEAAATNVVQPTQATQPAGRTTGPDLTAVALSQSGTFGNQYVATYTFDEAIATAPNTPIAGAANNLFRLYLADGTGLVATTCTTGPATTGTTTTNTVVCSGYNTFTSVTNPAPSATVATNAQIGSATAGTVDDAAVTDAATNQNPEGYEVTTGGTGTPAV